MAWTYEQVMEALGDKAQAVPGGILVYDDSRKMGERHVLVAEVSINGGFSVTPDGVKLLKGDESDVVEQPVKASRTKQKGLDSGQ